MNLKVFFHNSKHYIRATPVKSLFNSNLIHNVITRGDVFAVCLETGMLTIIPGTAEVIHLDAQILIQQGCL